MRGVKNVICKDDEVMSVCTAAGDFRKRMMRISRSHAARSWACAD